MIQVFFGETDISFEIEKKDLSHEYEKIAMAAVNKLALRGDAQVEVSFFLPEEIKELNYRTRNIDKVTDVLSYPALEEIKEFTKDNYPFDYDDNTNTVFLGSIVICMDRAKEQAEEYGHSLLRETKYLFVHGLLHLLGYDHENEDDRKTMRHYEELILQKADLL